MPGIIGLIDSETKTALFEAMIRRVKDRSVIEESLVKNDVHLGRIHHNYTNTAVQPLYSEDRRYVIFMTGELFSYKSCETDAIGEDTEFFLDCFIQKGIEALPGLNGQYAACIYDFLEKKLILITDRYGTQPVYYVHCNKRFAFAPELKLLVDTCSGKEIDYHAISDLFHFGHLFGYKTMFKNIRQIPEASYLVYQNGKYDIHRYWDYPYYEEAYQRKQYSKTEINDYIDELEEKITRAVRRQITSNRKRILFSLSGGLDSRYVVAITRKLSQDPIHAFTMGEINSDDRLYASRVANRIQAHHYCIAINPGDTWRDAAAFAFLADSMSMINGPVQGYQPLRQLASDFDVTLSSQMCDAVFGNTLQRKRIMQLYQKKHFDFEAGHILENIFNLFSSRRLEILFQPEFYNKIKDTYLEVPRTYLDTRYHPLHAYYRLLMNEHGRRGTLGGNLVNNEFLFTRMPSYDYDLMDFAFRLPVVLKKQQFVYRKTFCRMFPDLSRIPRQGIRLPICAGQFRLRAVTFENKLIGRLNNSPVNALLKHFRRWNIPNYVNYKEWFKYELREEIENLLFARPLSTGHLYRTGAIRDLFNDHLYSERDHTRLLWQIINLEYFYQNFKGEF